MSVRYRQKLASQLFEQGDQQERFVHALEHPPEPARALIWTKERPEEVPFAVEPPFSWQPPFVDRLSGTEWSRVRPGSHILHEEGMYYCTDMSSIFCGRAVLELAERTRAEMVFDVGASPGGKSVLAWCGLRPTQLIANEPIRSRVGALISNFRRCGIRPAIVTSSDPAFFSERLSRRFDLVIADVPCSGQSLPMKGVSAPNAFHPVVIGRNANRQKRIVATIAESVAPGGYLAYMTCTFASEENEAVIGWFLKRFSDFSVTPVASLDGYRSHLSEHPVYRLWPWCGMGAGGFTALLRRKDDGEQQTAKVSVRAEELFSPTTI